MTGYTKLFQSIVTSTIWTESDATRIVWITMLAIANKYGEVAASVPGLANISRVTLEQCEKAIKVLEGPDKHSRTRDYDGRRIAPIDGGWQVLNYAKHRKMASEQDIRERNAERQRRFKRKRRGNAEVTQSNAWVTQDNAEVTPTCHIAEAEAEAEAEADIQRHTMSPFGDVVCGKISVSPKTVRMDEDQNPKSKLREQATEILAYLNEKASKRFCLTGERAKRSLKFIESRLKSGATVEEAKKVIDVKTSQWFKNPEMRSYLRPETLFNATKFESYVCEAFEKTEPTEMKVYFQP
jgi:uncharacterized phage protein (TIGR02220 family)